MDMRVVESRLLGLDDPDAEQGEQMRETGRYKGGRTGGRTLTIRCKPKAKSSVPCLDPILRVP